MQRRKADDLTLKEREQWFVSLYIKKGATAKHVAACEKRAGLIPGDGKAVLKRKSVQKQIEQALEPVKLQQVRQAVITGATIAAKKSMQEELLATVTNLMTIKRDVLDHVLMEGVIGLNLHMYPKEKLEFLKAAYIIQGTASSTGLTLSQTADTPLPGQPSGIYQSLFARQLAEPKEKPLEAPQKVDGVFDLYPSTIEQTASEPIPEPAKATSEPSKKKATTRGVTVEIG